MLGKNEIKIRVPTTLAGFVILVTGIVVLLKGIWMTAPLGTVTWGIILGVGLLLIIIGVVAVYRGE